MIKGLTAPDPFYPGGLDGKIHPDHDKFEGTFFTNVVGPYLQKGVIHVLDQMEGQGKESHGTWKSGAEQEQQD